MQNGHCEGANIFVVVDDKDRGGYSVHRLHYVSRRMLFANSPKGENKVSNFCAASSQPAAPRASAAACCARHTASSVSSRTAASANDDLSFVTKPVSPSATRSRRQAMSSMTAGRPLACASAAARQKV